MHDTNRISHAFVYQSAKKQIIQNVYQNVRQETFFKNGANMHMSFTII